MYPKDSYKNIVEEYKIGNTTIKICDEAYKDKTSEDIRKILERITIIGWKCIRSARTLRKDI